MSLDLEQLLARIPGPDPVGSDLRNETVINSLYFKLKDARSQARMIERSIEAAGESPSVPLEWQTVRTLASEALIHRSKDLEVAAWLLESLVRLEDFAGLATGFKLLKGLADSFWPALHSVDEDDAAGRVSPLAGLNGASGEGALVQPIRMVCLFPGGAYGVNALWHLSRVQKEPDGALARSFNEMRTSCGVNAIRERALQASAAREAFIALTSTLDELCGADSPPSSHIRNALDAVLDAYRSLIGGADLPTVGATPQVEATPASIADGVTAATVVQPSVVVTREVTTREEAFSELLRIADFFRRMEPHSPLSYALETLVARGRMSLIDLLQELMPDESNRRQLLQHAGIHASIEGKIQQ